MHVTNETKQLARRILDYWDRAGNHDQFVFVEDGGLKFEEVDGETLCKTNMCAAGTAVFITRNIKEFEDFVEAANVNDDLWVVEARELLGLDVHEANEMFFNFNDSQVVDQMRAIAEGDAEKFKHLQGGVLNEVYKNFQLTDSD